MKSGYFYTIAKAHLYESVSSTHNGWHTTSGCKK